MVVEVAQVREVGQVIEAQAPVETNGSRRYVSARLTTEEREESASLSARI